MAIRALPHWCATCRRPTAAARPAALCGVSPVEHSSGKPNVTGSTVAATAPPKGALGTIPNNRLIHDVRTREYAVRRTATGSNRKEIIRPLKRYIVRQVFTEIRRAHLPRNLSAEDLDIGASTP